MERLRGIFARSGFIGQGNPAITAPPADARAMPVRQCPAARTAMPTAGSSGSAAAKYMAPLYDPRTQKPEDATACIDQFEFPDIPCTYPVVWVQGREAAEICAAMGKRLCDAHEWEGACAGRAGAARLPLRSGQGRRAERGGQPHAQSAHNRPHTDRQELELRPRLPARASAPPPATRAPSCQGGGWNDLRLQHLSDRLLSRTAAARWASTTCNGNAAEHMNLPLAPSQMASRGSTTLGVHRDEGQLVHLRQLPRPRRLVPLAGALLARQPGDGRPGSHPNYHLGFRCCKTLN